MKTKLYKVTQYSPVNDETKPKQFNSIEDAFEYVRLMGIPAGEKFVIERNPIDEEHMDMQAIKRVLKSEQQYRELHDLDDIDG